MKIKKKIMLLAAVLFMSAAGGCEKKAEILEVEEFTEENFAEAESAQPMAEEAAVCYVHICGEVRKPGVYRMKSGERICTLIELAGGFTEYASEDYVNQAKPVEDGMKVVVPALGSETADTEEDTRININSATKAQLCTLPGIGESRADSIIAYREAHGGFKSIEEIMKVDGIKDGAFSKIKESITVQ